jgi:hypothetical protein
VRVNAYLVCISLGRNIMAAEGVSQELSKLVQLLWLWLPRHAGGGDLDTRRREKSFERVVVSVVVGSGSYAQREKYVKSGLGLGRKSISVCKEVEYSRAALHGRLTVQCAVDFAGR